MIDSEIVCLDCFYEIYKLVINWKMLQLQEKVKPCLKNI